MNACSLYFLLMFLSCSNIFYGMHLAHRIPTKNVITSTYYQPSRTFWQFFNTSSDGKSTEGKKSIEADSNIHLPQPLPKQGLRTIIRSLSIKKPLNFNTECPTSNAGGHNISTANIEIIKGT